MIILSSRLPSTTGRTAQDWQTSHQSTRLLYGPPTTTTRTGRNMLDGQGCHHLPPTSTNHGIELHPATLINLDTMFTLKSGTLVSRVEPPPSRWTDIILEQTYEYRNRCRRTRFTHLIMQGTRYTYKLIITYMSDTAEYKLCEYINLEDNSIKEFRVLQRRGRAKLIPNTPRQPREPKEELLHLNSTILRTKQERNLGESNLRCVFIWSPYPLIYRCAHWVLLSCNQQKLCRTDLGSQ
jgi:hypothetical protein